MAVTDILISPAVLWYAPVGEALPDETTVEYGDAWGGNWLSVGYTLQPLSINYNQDIFELEVEQVSTPVKRTITKESVAFETVLAEFTGANLELIFGGTLTTTAAGASQRGYQQLESGGRVDIDEYAWGFEGLYKDSSNNQFPVRVFIYRGAATLNGQLTFAKAAGVGIPISIAAQADTSKAVGKQLMVIHKVTAEATS